MYKVELSDVNRLKIWTSGESEKMLFPCQQGRELINLIAKQY